MRVLKNTLNFFVKLLSILNKNWKILLPIVITLYGILCTIYSDIFIQNHNNLSWLLRLPYDSILNQEEKITLEKLVEEEEQQQQQHGNKDQIVSNRNNNVYIFVLDVSASMDDIKNSDNEKNKHLMSSLKKKYNELIERNKELFTKFGVEIEIKSEPDVIDVAKAQIFEFLLDLLKKNNNHKMELRDSFAVWTLGNKGEKIFPQKNEKARIEKNAMKDAVKKIVWITKANESDTNFENLFDRFSGEYEDELKKNLRSDFDHPFFIITILSDLIHDVKVRKETIETNWKNLEEKVIQICNSRTIINMIIFSGESWDIQRTIFPFFKKNIDWYRLNKYIIGKEEKEDLMNIVRVSRNNVKFYYTNPYCIEKSSFLIRSASNHNIQIDIPQEVNSLLLPKFNIFCEKLEDKNSRRKIFSGGSGHAITLAPNQMIRLTYSGRLPSDLSFPILRLSVKNKGRTLLIPIDFIRKFPVWAAGFFILLQILFIFIILSLFVISNGSKENK